MKAILLHYEMKVSQVNKSNLIDTTKELRNAYEKFTNKIIYLSLLTKLRASICKKMPKLKSPEWNQIQIFCQTGRTDFEKELHSQHFKKHFCQKIGSNNSKENGVVLPSFSGGSEVILQPGVGIVPVNGSQDVNSTLASLNSSGCTVTSYEIKNGTVMIKAKRNTPEELRRKKHEERRQRVEIVLTSLSLVAITFSLIVLSCIRTQSPQSAEKFFIHKNLLLAWGLGYAVYIADVTAFESRNQKPALCTAVAVVSHFFQTAIFTWMVVEAVNLFIKLVKVISTRTFYITYLIIGWGIPAIIVGITAAARTSTYDMNQPINKSFICGDVEFTSQVNRSRCWLNGSKWLYRGPVLAFLVVNFAIFVMLLKVVFGRIAAKYQTDQITRTRKGLKSVAVLLPLLGVTWLFGFFVDFHEALDYIFIVLTSTQGMVFCVFHCLLDGQVRKTFNQILRACHVDKAILPGKQRREYTVNGNVDKQRGVRKTMNGTNETPSK